MKDPFAPLIAIAQQGTPVTARDGQAFVRLDAPSGGCYVLPVRSRAYRDWFFHAFYAEYDTLPNSRAFHAILNHLEAEAGQNGPADRFPVWRRVGTRSPGHILLDLSNPECQFVEITPTGWTTTVGSGALLQTSRATIALPEPMPSSAEAPFTLHQAAPAALGVLRSCLHLQSRADWLRCLAWILSALRPNGPFPVLILQGPPGSGKSLAARILRSLLDPSAATLTAIPSSARDLLTLARHNWVLGFDHLSALSPPLCDALCRLSSGLGATLRETPGHATEPLQQYFKRPVLLTVTGRWSCPVDLAERALTLNFPPFTPGDPHSSDSSPSGPRTEQSLLKSFEEAWPGILAALCSAVSTALSRIDHVELPFAGQAGNLRCANALAWAMAASPALGCTEEEMQQAFGVSSESYSVPHPIVEAVRNLLEQRRQWSGSATQLLDLLKPLVPDQAPGASTTRKLSESVNGLSRQLRKSELTLADNGIELKFRHLHTKKRVIELREEGGGAIVPKSPPKAPPDFAPTLQPEQTEELRTA